MEFTVTEKEMRIIELLREINAERVNQKMLIKLCEEQHKVINSLVSYCKAGNRAEPIPICEAAQKGNINNGEAKWLNEYYPKEIKQITNFGDNIMSLNKISDNLKTLEIELELLNIIYPNK